MRDIKLIFIFIFSFAMLQSQTDTTLLKKAKGKTLKKMGKSALQQNDPSSAITFFEIYVKANPTDAEAKDLLAKSYMQIRDYDRAQRMFLQAYNTNKEKAPEALFYHALMMKSNSRYDSAKYNFQKFKKEYKGEQKKLKKLATREIAFCDSVVRLIGVEYKIVIQHLDTSINKINTEGAPIAAEDNLLLFTSLRTEKKEYLVEDDTASSPKRKLYFAERKGDEWKFKGEYGDNLNDPSSNTGNACFSVDRNRIYFTRCKLNYMEEMICAIYVSEKGTDGSWSEPVKLPKHVNNPKYTSTMPAVTVDPVKGNDLIYFVSNNKEGKGGMDIWYTIYDKKNKIYKEPKNAGTKVNTSQDEISPFFDTETRTLYFSSEGQGGLGGFDIFRTKGDGKKFIGSENIGQPINTGADDIFYTISTNRGEGFFVSNRKGGNALKNSTCCDDIYFYKHSEYIRLFLEGTITDVLDQAIVSDATIELYIKDKKTSEKFLVKTLKSDSQGKYKTPIEAGQDYFLVVKKDDFLGTSEDVTTQNITSSRSLSKDLQLIKKPKDPIRIPNILYEFNKADMLGTSQVNLDTTVLRLMQLNPELIVEIQAHTDNKGSDAYNLKLSQRRAETVVAYLKSKGIDAKRLQAKGYGETKPIAPNENPDGSDNPDGRAKNRRTDFKIIGVIDAEIINDAEVD